MAIRRLSTGIYKDWFVFKTETRSSVESKARAAKIPEDSIRVRLGPSQETGAERKWVTMTLEEFHRMKPKFMEKKANGNTTDSPT